MAVRTEQSQILDPIVGPPTVDVIEFERSGLIVPLRNPTASTLLFKHSLFDETLLEIGITRGLRMLHKQVCEWVGILSGITSGHSPVMGLSEEVTGGDAISL